jgi:hypothetical protein
MRAVNLARVAAEAEVLRYKAMVGRQGSRAAMGATAAVFAISVLVLLNVAGWQALLWYVRPIYATLILLGINFVLMAIFGLLAARSGESRAEIDALHIRQKALEEMRSALMINAAIPLIGTLFRRSRQKVARHRIASR